MNAAGEMLETQAGAPQQEAPAPYDFHDAPPWYCRLNEVWLQMHRTRIVGVGFQVDDAKACDWMNTLNSALALSKDVLARPTSAADCTAPMQPSNVELDLMRSVYEQARKVLRFTGIDKPRAEMAWDELDRAIERVKEFDGGTMDALAAPTQAAPAAQAAVGEATLPHDITVGGATFRKGVKLSTFVLAAQGWHREAHPKFYTLTDEQKADNLASLIAEPLTRCGQCGRRLCNCKSRDAAAPAAQSDLPPPDSAYWVNHDVTSPYTERAKPADTPYNLGWMSGWAAHGRAYPEQAAPAAQPIDMVLHCPKCGLQHIDAPDERTPDWKNEPHRSHLCHGCGHIWRPADVPTNGVRAVKTRGKADSAAPAAAVGPSEGWFGRCDQCGSKGGHRTGCSAAAPEGLTEPYCLMCEKLGHITDECWSTYMVGPRSREIDRLSRPASDDAKAAERYRWLRSIDSSTEWNRIGHYAADALDKKIDAAIAASMKDKP